MKKKTLVPLIVFYWAYALLASIHTKLPPMKKRRESAIWQSVLCIVYGLGRYAYSLW